MPTLVLAIDARLAKDGAMQFTVAADGVTKAAGRAAGATDGLGKSTGLLGTALRGLAALADLPPFSVVYITNNVNYISFLEEGTPKTLPVGMVAVTVEELQEMFKEIQ